ncbi:MAG TPA: class I SAM-dependent methyltransferase [Caulobacterales bacterium]|nr:class I SAM-dependent methyltransferase [Caulobacterales bacterium]
MLRQMFKRALAKAPAPVRPSTPHDKYIGDYEAIVNRLVAQYGRDEGVLRAVGGSDQQGDFQLAQLTSAGLTPTSHLVDVGCGSGRLTRRIARAAGARYLGTDINRVLLDYARDSAGRADFRFEQITHSVIPEQDGVADMVSMFSVATHILHEDTYCYLEEGKRVLKPGGRIFFSFLDFNVQLNRDVFMSKVGQAKHCLPREHFDVFIGRHDIPIWADMLGMKLIEIIPGDEERTYDSPHLAAFKVQPLRFLLGQSAAILEKV